MLGATSRQTNLHLVYQQEKPENTNGWRYNQKESPGIRESVGCNRI